MSSRPTYRPLSADPSAGRHILVVDRYGLPAARRVLTELHALGVHADALVLAKGSGKTPPTTPSFIVVCSLDRLSCRLDALLREAGMGLRLYIAGTESFVWAVDGIAGDHALGDPGIQREACGPSIRRVFCVHCRELIEEASTTTVSCSACGRLLEVRDHFSRRLGAYLGVSVVAHQSRKSSG